MRTLVLTDMEFQYMRYIFCRHEPDADSEFDAASAALGLEEKLTNMTTPATKAKADVWSALHEIARSY